MVTMSGLSPTAARTAVSVSRQSAAGSGSRRSSTQSAPGFSRSAAACTAASVLFFAMMGTIIFIFITILYYSTLHRL